MGSFILILLLLGAIPEISQSAICPAQCDYDHVTSTANCSSRNLDCIPNNYPEALVMDLSHNNISQLEPDDLDGSFRKVLELILDYNSIEDLTPVMTPAHQMDTLKKLSVQHNLISHTPYDCRLSSLEVFLVDYNFLTYVYEFLCPSLKIFSANFNGISNLDFFHDGFLNSHPSLISLQFNQIRYVFFEFWGLSHDQKKILLDNNEITSVDIYSDNQNIGVLSLNHNNLQYINIRSIPFELNVASNRLRKMNGFSLMGNGDNLMEKLDIRNNSFDALIQPDWAEGLQILYADDNILANLSSLTLQGFINLTEFHVANNRLLFISSSALSQLEMLRYLYLDGNALTSLLGGVFLHQGNLEELSITNNQLSVLHPTDFLGLTSLERLDLSGNRLIQVSSQMFRQMPDITMMDLSDNKLEVLDVEYCDLTGLQKLSLAKNSVHDISDIVALCRDMQILDVSFNKIEVVHGESLTGQNRALSRLELEGNPLQCDCRLAVLRDWLRNNPPHVPPRCQDPAQHSGAVVTNLDISNFICISPKVTTTMNSVQVEIGQTATLSCTATGIPAPDVSWLDPNGTIISMEWNGRFVISQNKTLVIISVYESDQGTYTCLAQSVLGNTDHAVVELRVITDTHKIISNVSLAASVLPSVFVTLVVTLTLVVLVIFLRRRYTKRNGRGSAGPRERPQLQATFSKQVTRSDVRSYVTEVAGESAAPSTIQVLEGAYENPVNTENPPHNCQEVIREHKDDEYEAVYAN